jgi:hypothetical protein
MAAINRWWEGLPSERYWMEITDREDLGSDLFAPQVDDAGRPYWSYNLVTEVLVGDVVLHWHKSLHGNPGMVGRSVVSGPPEHSEIVWQARGTVGRAAAPSGPEPAWLVPLADYTPLLDPVDQVALRREEAQLRSIKAALDAAHAGALYFPFAFSDNRPIRTTQGYLVKYPAAAIEIFPELELVPRSQSSARPRRVSPRPAGTTSRYQNDPLVRVAVERHAVALAAAHYVAAGFAVEDVGGFAPYDLDVTRATETRHVEVKGLTGSGETVELTAGEVRNAETYQPTDRPIHRHSHRLVA